MSSTVRSANQSSGRVSAALDQAEAFGPKLEAPPSPVTSGSWDGELGGSATYAQIVDRLKRTSTPVRELHGRGSVAITLAAGRIVALAFNEDGPNLLWSNPELSNSRQVRKNFAALVGGIGGERLRFAPELDYYWNGKPDWESFENYNEPAAIDPGAYRFVRADASHVNLHAKGRLKAHGSNFSLSFAVERDIRSARSPLALSDPIMRDVDFVGVETSHHLSLDRRTRAGRIGLWHLLQVPTGSILVVPFVPTASADRRKPLSYGLPGSWTQRSDHILWQLEGRARAKFGLSAAAVTGRAGVLRQLGVDRWCLIVRQFPVDANATYGDHPYGVIRHDQVLQAWDGFGFGELEYHSPVLDAGHGPRELRESDELWAFGGSAQRIVKLTKHLIGVDVDLDVYAEGAAQ